ncbi:hypothetical protein ANCCEY_02062 [Ancylostoma ceylanicum]|uniref:Uncharacterized protein n=2 Tax=Ancylostoma TaxID=29169 RepID=A0A0D6M436_9BILA|nr:hypothetical protein ANCCEY_02062 [Ancylostoma ceylanicum]
MTGRVVGEVTAGRKGDGAGQSARRLARPFGAGAGSSLYGLVTQRYVQKQRVKAVQDTLCLNWEQTAHAAERRKREDLQKKLQATEMELASVKQRASWQEKEMELLKLLLKSPSVPNFVPDKSLHFHVICDLLSEVAYFRKKETFPTKTMVLVCCYVTLDLKDAEAKHTFRKELKHESPSEVTSPMDAGSSTQQPQNLLLGIAQYILCQLCPEQAPDLKVMEDHFLRAHVNKEKRNCEACPSEDQPDLIQHMRRHTNRMNVTPDMNEESNRVLVLLEEIQETQLNILERLSRPNETFSVELARLNNLLLEIPVVSKAKGSKEEGRPIVAEMRTYLGRDPGCLMISDVEHYLPILRTLATDIVQICERIEALRNRLAAIKDLLLRAMCCSATAIECAAGLVCLRAVVVSPQKSFILSGCHVPEDGLIGNDAALAVFLVIDQHMLLEHHSPISAICLPRWVGKKWQVHLRIKPTNV